MQKIAAIVLLILLAAVGYGWWYTNQPAAAAARPSKASQHIDAATGVDQSTFALAQRLAAMAEGPDEQSLAESAQRLADHELDVAFAQALRQIQAHPPTLSPEAKTIQQRLDKSQKQLEADEARVTQLTAAVGQANDAQRPGVQSQLDLVATQLELDKDEVEEANQELLEAGGNLPQRIQQMMQKHSSEPRVHPGSGVPAPSTAGPKGVVRDFQQWRRSRLKQAWLVYASQQATAGAARLGQQWQQLVDQLEASKGGVPLLAQHTRRARSGDTGNAADATTSSGANAKSTSESTPTAQHPDSNPATPVDLLATARQISADQKLLTLLDQRVSALRELAGLYAQWDALAALQTTSMLHAMLQGLAIVLIIILVLLFVDRSTERVLGRMKLDRRQLETLRSVTRVALQVLGILIIVLVLIGVPGQIGTMIGLAGAGLTVALKDFIVAFIGWLVLMGRNGVRLGDWVEINGVTGEVVELGMFHTVLLETGNWTDAGHPTGRRVTFTNSFAIEKHYFNFSTAGQWLWDELVVLVPFDKDPNAIADAINKEVLAATADSASQAESEWSRSSPNRRGSTFSAAPGITVKPAVGGIEVAFRYITRASERFQLRSRLFQAAVRLLSLENPSHSSANQKGAT